MKESKGAEAVVRESRMIGAIILVKDRIAKGYRIPALDLKLRKERTKQEARLLHRAKLAGVPCPTMFFVDEFSIGLSKIAGARPKMDAQECASAGEMLSKLHNSGIIHGDFTPANLISAKEGLFVIDFGLGFLSSDIEDKAVDVLTMLKSLENKAQAASFFSGYKKEAKEYEKIVERIEEVKKRARYS